MVHGSGALDFDETVFKNRPFRDIAEGLAARGVSSLRYDKRTYAYRQPVSSMDEETILDALSAIQKAHQYSKHVFLLGHSLGAMLAPLIALRAEGVKSDLRAEGDKSHQRESTTTTHTTAPFAVEGVIMLAAPSRDLEEVVREQFDYLLPSGASQSFKNEQIEAIRTRSPHYFEEYHQTEAAKRLKRPIFILQGERDYQVSMKDFEGWKTALQGRPKTAFRSYPSLNHLFIEGEGKSTPLEYQTEGHVAKEILDDISSFINNKL